MFHPICSFFLLVEICLFVPLSEVIFQVISFHVNIIKRESLNWLLAEGSFLVFFPLLLGMLDDVVKLADVWFFLLCLLYHGILFPLANQYGWLENQPVFEKTYDS